MTVVLGVLYATFELCVACVAGVIVRTETRRWLKTTDRMNMDSITLNLPLTTLLVMNFLHLQTSSQSIRKFLVVSVFGKSCVILCVMFEIWRTIYKEF